MAELRLLRGQTAFIDDEDMLKVVGFNWRLSTKGYVVATVPGCKPQRTIWLHRWVLGTPDDLLTDHHDHDKLNNRKVNLRPASYTKNNGNKTKKAGTSSKFKGVTWVKRSGKWKAQISVLKSGSHKVIGLGYFSDEKQAAAAYNSAATRYFGEFALLNSI